jgi:hypothetical protein
VISWFLKVCFSTFNLCRYAAEEFTRVGELKSIRNAVDAGTVDSIFDKVWYQRAVMVGLAPFHLDHNTT